MDKSVAALMIAMVVSVMGIPLAYLAGQGSAQAALKEELAQSRVSQEKAIAAMQIELAEIELRQQGMGNVAAPKAAGKPLIVGTVARTGPQSDRAAPGTAIEFEIFKGLAIGTDYEGIVKALGREGTRTLSIVDKRGAVTEQFVWDWTKADGSRGKIDLSFFGGKLQDKSYKG